jgi:hypothetical protein
MKRKALKAAVISAVVLIIGGSTPVGAEQTGRYKSNGAYAAAFGSDETGCRSFVVVVSRGGTTKAPETYLFYDVYDFCTDMWWSGNGLIPNADFRTGKTVTLVTSGLASSTFVTQAEGLPLSLTFTRSDVFTTRWSGHSRIEYLGHVVQRHGSTTNSSANISGSIGGSGVSPSSSGEIGASREHVIEFDRGTK